MPIFDIALGITCCLTLCDMIKVGVNVGIKLAVMSAAGIANSLLAAGCDAALMDAGIAALLTSAVLPGMLFLLGLSIAAAGILDGVIFCSLVPIALGLVVVLVELAAIDTTDSAFCLVQAGCGRLIIGVSDRCGIGFYILIIAVSALMSGEAKLGAGRLCNNTLKRVSDRRTIVVDIAIVAVLALMRGIAELSAGWIGNCADERMCGGCGVAVDIAVIAVCTLMCGIAHLRAGSTGDNICHLVLGLGDRNGVRIAAGASVFHLTLCRAGSLFGDCSLAEGVSDRCGIVTSIGFAAMRAGINGIADLGMSGRNSGSLPIMTACYDVADVRCSAMLAGVDSIACLVAGGSNNGVFIRMLKCGRGGEIAVCAAGLAFILNDACVRAGGLKDNIALHIVACCGNDCCFAMDESAALTIVLVCQAVGCAGRSIAGDYCMSVLPCRVDCLLLDNDLAAAIAVRALGLAAGAAGGRNGGVLDLVVSEFSNSRRIFLKSAVDADKLARAILGAGRRNELLDECMVCVNSYIKRSGSTVLILDIERMLACRERLADKLECLVREMPVSCERIEFTHRIISIACVRAVVDTVIEINLQARR